MTANELRIGNWAYHQGAEMELNVKRFEYAVCKERCVGLKPIPLTEEWLSRFGLNDNQHTRITIPRNIKYVHQLQNLFFALTGEELVLKTT